MSKGRVRVGLVGAGFAGRTHARSISRATDLGVELVAVAAAHLPRAEELARQYGIPAAYDDYRRIVERDDIDIIDLCVPNHLHESIALETIRAGKHVICEKPLTGYFGGPGADEPVGATPKGVMLAEAVRSADRMLAAARERGSS